MQEYIKKILGSRHNRPSSSASHNTSNDEINDIIKIIKPLQDSGLLLKGVTETVQNEVKEEKGGFLSMLLGTLDARLLGNHLTGRGIRSVGKGKGKGVLRAGEGVLGAGYGHPSQNKMYF